ncbi:MAG TPA: acyl-CoA dehydrogenase family protein [Acidimicrobiales bacterium]
MKQASDSAPASDPYRLPIDASSDERTVIDAVREWVATHVPASWREAAARGGPAAIREVRTRADYEAWYPVFARSGMVAPALPVEYGGLGVSSRIARLIENELRPYNLGRLNVLGLNLAAPALLAFGTEEQKRRFLPPIVRNEEVWCQLFSEPGAGSDLASLSTRAERDGDHWAITGQKVWNTWAHIADYGVLLARTDPNAPKREGITYFLCPMRAEGVTVRPLRHITGEVDFSEVFLDGVRVPDFNRLGEVGAGWKVANATLSGERNMVSGAGAGGVDRIGGSSVRRLITTARANGAWNDPLVRQRLMALWCEERVREWTNSRVRDNARAGRPPGPESSIGKVHQGELNQRIQEAAVDILGPAALAWQGPAGADPAAYGESLPFAVHGMLRSRANTIEGGTSEINRNIIGERVLGLPREPDPWKGVPWRDVPRS